MLKINLKRAIKPNLSHRVELLKRVLIIKGYEVKGNTLIIDDEMLTVRTCTEWNDETKTYEWNDFEGNFISWFKRFLNLNDIKYKLIKN
jgi:hypothetical protein